MQQPGFEPRSKAAAAYERLRHEIRTGELAPGERVTLHRLSEQLGMSLTPVREALNKLASEGFVVHRRHHGTRIAEFSSARMEQTYRLRKVLEPMAVRLAAERADRLQLETELARVEELLGVCDRASTALEVVRSNEEFHRGLYRLSGDPLLEEFIEKLWAGVPYQSLSLYEGGERVRQSGREHRLILDAVAAGEGEAAAERLREHIEHGEAVVLSSL